MARDARDRIRESLLLAQRNCDFFFMPWLGYGYTDGIDIFGTGERKKVMVLGASRYCCWSHAREEKDEPICEHMDVCTGICQPELMKINDGCPYVNEKTRRGGYNADLGLMDMATAAILEYNYALDGRSSTPFDTVPDAYRNFSECLAGALEMEETQLWKGLSFTNYLQPMVWGPTLRKRTETPSRGRAEWAYIYSRMAVEDQIMILDPDIILLWASTPLYDILDTSLFSSTPRKVGKAIVCESGGHTKTYRDMTVRIGRDRRVIPCPHPSGNYFRDYMEKRDFSLSYITPEMISRTAFSVVEEHSEYTWEDFRTILRELGKREMQGLVD